MVAAAEFLTVLRARVDWLSAKVQLAEAAWRDYVNAANALERSQGARPFTARQGVIASVATWLNPVVAGSRAALWNALDIRYGRQYSETFGDLRTALRQYDAIITQLPSVTGSGIAQQTEIFNLRNTGEALKGRGRAANTVWVESGASAFDPKISTDADSLLRALVRVTPYARWESSAPSLLTAGGSGGSATGASSDIPVPVPQPEQAGLPPWVAPVVGGILVVGVGYALWNYSRSH